MADKRPVLYESLLELVLNPHDRLLDVVLDSLLLAIDAEIVRVELHDRTGSRLTRARGRSLRVVEKNREHVSATPQLHARLDNPDAYGEVGVTCVPVQHDEWAGAVHVAGSAAIDDKRRAILDRFARAIVYVAPRLASSRPRQLAHQTRAFQRSLIVDALKRCHWDVAAAANVLGIGRSTLYKRMVELEIRFETSRGKRRNE